VGAGFPVPAGDDERHVGLKACAESGALPLLKTPEFEAQLPAMTPATGFSGKVGFWHNDRFVATQMRFACPGVEKKG
jgi:hypothetical protein